MARREYTDVEKAEALAVLCANNGNVYRTAKQLSIPDTTLQRWANGQRINADIPKIAEVKKKDLADRLEEIAHSLIDSTPEKIGDASLKDTIVSLAVAIEKMQLLRGKSTDNTNVTFRDDTQRRDALMGILERGRQGKLAADSRDRGTGEPATLQ